MDKQHGVCPWQGGHMLAGFMRRLFHNPYNIMKPYLTDGMTAMDIGCGMGFFSIPMSKIVGCEGKVIAVDLQPQMLDGLTEYAAKAGTTNITAHQCAKDSLHIEQWKDTVDFAVIFWMLHEVPDAERLIDELRHALSADGKVLFAEPYVHVNTRKFRQGLKIIENAGFKMIGEPKIAISRTALFQKS